VRTDPCFAICAPGLAPLTSVELASLGIPARPETGGVSFDADPRALYRANLHLRTATRVLLRLGTFRARTFPELERRARAVSWSRLLGPGTPYRLRVSCSKSKLYHEGAVAERLHGAIEATTGARPAPGSESDDEDARATLARVESDAHAANPAETPGEQAQLFVIRFFRDVCTVSADTSGAPLYMRGYRQELARAPLRETLAATVLLGAGWPTDQLLVDPFCGSGTIPIEAALIARRIPPGLANLGRQPRPYRFESWPDHDADAWAACVAEAQGDIRARASAPLFGFDRDPGAIRAARANGERAGLAGDVEFREQSFEGLAPLAPTGWLVTNPPYGVRVGDESGSRRLLNRLAQVTRSTLAAWTICALGPEPLMRRTLGADAETVLRTRTGGIQVSLFVRRPHGAA
jgi:putative N6-adenine-specific DNA methylase